MHQHQQHHHAKRDGLDDIRDYIDGLLGRDNHNDNGNSHNDNEPVIIYKTVAPTFDGPIGGYRTGDSSDTQQKTAEPPKLGAPVQQTKAPDPSTTQKETKPTQKPETTDKPKAEPTTHKTDQPKPTQDSTLVQSPSVSATPTTSSPTGIDDASLASSSPSSTTAADSAGLSGGAKAGIAIGVIALVGLIAVGAFFFIRKKKKERDIAEPDNEKSFTAAAPPPPRNPSPPPMQTTPTTAPQLNLRPVTQFSPDFGGNRVSSGNMLAAGAAGAAAGVAASAAANRSLTGQQNGPSVPPKHAQTGSDPFNDPVDPFGNHAAASGPTSSGSPPANGVPAALQVRNPSPEAPSDRTISPETVATGVAATGTAVAAGAVAVRNSKSGKDPVPTVEAPPKGFFNNGAPPSPAVSDTVSVSSTQAGALAAGGGPGPNNVYRVQLDFSPSMDDEMGLKAGQLVRLVHEYDDGWALCVRLDRSQQGVAPRTCLSARPVKPRPRGPPPGAGPRGPPPMGPPGRPMSPAGGRSSPGPGTGPGPNSPRFAPPGNGRPASPNAGYKPYPPQGPPRFPPVPRSLSPGPGPRMQQHQQTRSMSPGPYGPGGAEKPSSPENQRRRSNSVGGAIAAANNLPTHPGTASESGQAAQEPAPQAPATEKAPEQTPEQEAPQPTPQQESSQSQPASDPAPAATPAPKEDPPSAPKSPPPSLGPVERKPVGGASQ